MYKYYSNLAKELFLERDEDRFIVEIDEIIVGFEEAIKEGGEDVINYVSDIAGERLIIYGSDAYDIYPVEPVDEFQFVFKEADYKNTGMYKKDFNAEDREGSHVIILNVLEEVSKEYLIENVDSIFEGHRKTMVHEITHALDDRRSNYEISPDQNYHESDQEINAYFIDAIDDMSKAIFYRHDGKIPEEWRDFDTFKKRFFRLYFSDSFRGKITKKVKNRIIKRLYKYWNKKYNLNND